MYGVSGIPHAQFLGTTDVIGGGVDMLPHYLPVYNAAIGADSPFEIDLSMNIENGQYEINADVSVTGDVTLEDENKIIFILTYDYAPSYTCSVQRYFDMDFDLTDIGETGSYSTTFTLENDWDLANVRGIAMIQKMNGSTGNYPIHQSAITLYPFVSPSPIEDQIINLNETVTFNVENYFNFEGVPVDIELSVTSSNDEITTASIENNILTVYAQQIIGEVEITISGEYDGFNATDIFIVQVIDPSTIPVVFHLYDSYGDGWAYGGNENFIQFQDEYITLVGASEGEYTVFILPGEYDYTYTAADNWGAENSWTINLLDGTELGAGSGGANGTTDHSFILEGPPTSTLSGVVSLEGDGDLTAIQIELGAFSTNPLADGSYTIELPIGIYSLMAYLDGYQDFEAEIEILEAENTTLDIEMLEVLGNDNDISFINELKGNYPNPFNPTTTISYSLANDANVMIEIYNSRGQKINTLVNEFASAGSHSIVWNGEDERGNGLTSGLYFYNIKSGRFTSTKKMILLK